MLSVHVVCSECGSIRTGTLDTDDCTLNRMEVTIEIDPDCPTCKVKREEESKEKEYLARLDFESHPEI